MLTIKLPDKEIHTGYGTGWPLQEKNAAHYIQLAQNVGFDIVAQKQDDRLFHLELQKP